MHKNGEKQTKDATPISSGSTDRKSGTNASELGAVASQLDATTPGDVVSQKFRDNLRDDLLKLQERKGQDVQEHVSKDIQERAGKK